MSYKIHYFAGYGRVEAIRMLLKHNKVDFEDVYYTFENIHDPKNSEIQEFGQLPVVERDGKYYSQSLASLRALGRILECYPEDVNQAYLVDSAMDAVNDIYAAYYKAAFGADEDAKKQGMSDLLNKTIPTVFGAL